jgi:hypothetical protein
MRRRPCAGGILAPRSGAPFIIWRLEFPGRQIVAEPKERGHVPSKLKKEAGTCVSITIATPI